MQRLTKILPVEDEALIALGASDMPLESGAQRVSISTYYDDVEYVLVRENTDLGLLDVDLGEDSCDHFPVLDYRGVPFVVTTGSPQVASLPLLAPALLLKRNSSGHPL